MFECACRPTVSQAVAIAAGAQPKTPNSKSGLQHRDDFYWTNSTQNSSARETDTAQPIKTFAPF